MEPIMPNQIHLDRTDDDSPTLDYNDDVRFTSRLSYLTYSLQCMLGLLDQTCSINFDASQEVEKEEQEFEN